jgi:hypothetical protein
MFAQISLLRAYKLEPFYQGFSLCQVEIKYVGRYVNCIYQYIDCPMGMPKTIG